MSINLSFFIRKKFKINKKNHLLIEKYLDQKIKDLYLKNPRLSVHKKLSYEILNYKTITLEYLIKLGKLYNISDKNKYAFNVL